MTTVLTILGLIQLVLMIINIPTVIYACYVNAKRGGQLDPVMIVIMLLVGGNMLVSTLVDVYSVRRKLKQLKDEGFSSESSPVTYVVNAPKKDM